jgi:cytidylate kinase
VNQKKLIIAIDGYSSCGKSTIAKELAALLHYVYLDSGSMYRAVTLYALRRKFIKDGDLDEKSLVQELKNIQISFRYNPLTYGNDTFLNGENIEKEIRELPVSQNVSRIAAIREIREFLVSSQREIGKEKGIVMDGRDIGTVVFPHAELKIFMTASPEIRAQRRYDELKAKGLEVNFEEIKNNIISRDRLDETREISPLRKASDAIVLDNSYLTREEQLQWAIEIVNKILSD